MGETHLQTSKEIEVRFSEVDSMNIVWHGSYALYFEDAREAFGKTFGLSYRQCFANQCYAPLVELHVHYKHPLFHGQRARVDIAYRQVPAAKIIFDYEIHLLPDNRLVTTGSSTQVFLDKDFRLLWENPPFYEAWKKKYNLL
ncbi:MAG: acyl-CoA thioesterase [Tannerella sp.]|nr:acyl-CoA thioesterase [Tannerella sp.]